MSTATDAVPMTDEQKYLFDLKGYVVIPGVLTEAELGPLREHGLADGSPFEGPAAELLDHPVAVGVLREIVAEDFYGAYGFRCESGFFARRKPGDKGLSFHAGRMRSGPMTYHVEHGRIFSGLTRIVWEINEVKAPNEGTLFLAGTHKHNFETPEHLRGDDTPLRESYECPAGSMVVFTENLTHAGGYWRTEPERLAYLYAYNHVQCQMHKAKPTMSHEVIMRMPEKRRTLFRGVWGHDFGIPLRNNWYGQDNRAL